MSQSPDSFLRVSWVASFFAGTTVHAAVGAGNPAGHWPSFGDSALK
jgi:hypothetical protein